MNIEPRMLLKPVVALGVMILIVAQTQNAIRRSGVWSRSKSMHAPAADPFAQLDRDLTTITAGSAAVPRDPMAFGASLAARGGAAGRPHALQPAAVSPVATPVLTAIVWDADPTASIRLGGHDYTVRVNSLFADYQVTNISREQVVLAHGGESLVLKLQSKGEPQ